LVYFSSNAPVGCRKMVYFATERLRSVYGREAVYTSTNT
jgi:hypothetical protein